MLYFKIVKKRKRAHNRSQFYFLFFFGLGHIHWYTAGYCDEFYEFSASAAITSNLTFVVLESVSFLFK